MSAMAWEGWGSAGASGAEENSAWPARVPLWPLPEASLPLPSMFQAPTRSGVEATTTDVFMSAVTSGALR